MKWKNTETGVEVDVNSLLSGVWVLVEPDKKTEKEPKKETKKRGCKEE